MTMQTSPLLPTTTPATNLGVLGGGQLGRMFAHAAQQMGYKVVVLDPAKDCPAGNIADQFLCAAYDDPQALQQLAQLCPAITCEFENVPAPALAKLAEHSFVAPRAASVAIAQNRIEEKRFFTQCGQQSGVYPAPHALIETEHDALAAAPELFPGILKTNRMGYDGKGQARVRSSAEARQAFLDMGGVTCVLEKMLPLERELSVLTARGADGDSVIYPIAENVHRDGILHTSTVPAPGISEICAAQARKAAKAIVNQLDYVGVLCIEFFVLTDGSLVVNEMATRPHNSGHYTIDACVTSQFAQQVRAMTSLPLGDVTQHSPAIMLNVMGDLWFLDASNTITEPAWDKVLAIPGTMLHLYGKEDARRARKMGHITIVAPNLNEARSRLVSVCELLHIEP